VIEQQQFKGQLQTAICNFSWQTEFIAIKSCAAFHRWTQLAVMSCRQGWFDSTVSTLTCTGIQYLQPSIGQCFVQLPCCQKVLTNANSHLVTAQQ